MLGDIYLGTALAIFLAIFGWSESILGLSQRTKEKEAEFIKKSKISLTKYIELRKLISNPSNLMGAEYTKKVINILRGTNIGADDREIFDKLRENNHSIAAWESKNKIKKMIISLLFVYLFFFGTLMLLFENNIEPFLFTLDSWIIILQVILFSIIVWGVFIYRTIAKFESEIQNNLNFLILRMQED